MIGIEGGRLNLVPVNFIVDAMDHIAHVDGLDGQCFHLVDPHPHRVGDILNLFARAAHAPEMTLRFNALMFAFVPQFIKVGLAQMKPARRIKDLILKDLGMPPDVMRFVNYPTRFDCRETLKALKGTDIAVPPLDTYAWKLWDYWERHLDPDLFIDRSLSGAVKGRVVLITGARRASARPPPSRSPRPAPRPSSSPAPRINCWKPSRKSKRAAARHSSTPPTSPTSPPATR